MQKLKRGQFIRVKDLNELPQGVPDFPRTKQGIALAGKVGQIVDIGGAYVALDIEATTEQGIVGLHPHEVENYIDPGLLRSYKVTLRDGTLYMIDTTPEGMKELAEFIGDDHLDTIYEKKD